ncbi:MAG: protein kinase [Chthoniobacterales bacterium]|nr:protein kinase [Chthoniobacterales bacterium]
MTPARFETIEEIFYSAIGQAPDTREAFLVTACEGDEALRFQVERLLGCHSSVGDFIETPVAGVATALLEGRQPELLPGQTMGHYELLERIGAGGMGEVYLARDIVASRKAALKVLPLRFTMEPERLRRFELEAHAVVALNHPNIVTVYEIGEDQATHYIASELIEGETLRRRLARGSIPLAEALEITLQVASALAAAHDAGIIHRDIKPENIMLRPDGYVKVLDFGIAKLAEQDLPVTTSEQEPDLLLQTRFGSIIGTASYMSPEQARGEAVSESSDIWSLGVVLSEMVGSIPAELQRLLGKMLANEPNERYADGGELVDEVRRIRKLLELRPHARRSRMLIAAAAVAAAAAIAVPSYFYHHRTPESLPDKSVAVLPFENLSDNQQDSYFAIGVQDEILSDLARIADLKVISRISTRSYEAGKPRNPRLIAEQLGVTHLLEGSVQRANNRLRIHAQLIDARSDSQLWAQTYDREVADLFTIQTEIAQTIATQLQAKISAPEKAAIARAPTSDLVANDLYQQAMALGSQESATNDLKAIDLLERAIARDARFVPAYCALARLQVEFYVNEGHADAHLQVAKATIRKAFQLQPNAGEVHLVQAHYLARGLRDYDGARAELDLARRGLPNDPVVYSEIASMDYRQGRWAESLRNHDRAIELDPRNVLLLENATTAYSENRRYSKAIQLGRRALALSPRDKWMRLFIASQPLKERADIRPLRAELNTILAEDPGAVATIWSYSLDRAILEHDAPAADRALAAIPPDGFHGLMGFLAPRDWFVGCAARAFNRPEVAHTAFVAARARLEKRLREQPDDAMSWGLLGKVKAMLGERQGAIEAGQRACELFPLTREGLWGLTPLRQLAKIYACVGEKDRALELLSLYAGQGPFIDYGELKLSPDWDPLRGDPRFEKIVASLAPKSEPPK